MSKVDFIIAMYNQLDYTKQCIDSILGTVKSPFSLILIDNASTDGTSDYLQALKANPKVSNQLTILRNEQNKGYAEALNQGLKVSHASYVFFCNNDIVFYPNAIPEMIRVAEARSEFGLINPNSNEFGLKKFDPELSASMKGKWIERCHTSGFCVMVKRTVIDKIGGIDTAFSPAYFEDMDYAERARKEGYLSVVALGSYVHHFGTRTFLPKEKQALWQRNRVLFEKRWGGTKWFAYVSSKRFARDVNYRQEIIKALLRVARQNTAVIFVLIPEKFRTELESRHHSFRVIPTPVNFAWLMLIGKLFFGKKKPISRIYVDDEKLRSKFGWIKRFSSVETHHLEGSQSTSSYN